MAVNQLLYDTLLIEFRDVGIVHEGEPRRVRYSPDYSRPGKLKAQVVQHGEGYDVNCPFCDDRRQRLRVNHHFGVPDPKTGSIYNFQQSIEDGATVPLFYENRIPELQLANENFNEDMDQLIEAAELDDEQEEKLEREFAREYHLITRDDRLEKVAEDLVAHFMGRRQSGKGMVTDAPDPATVTSTGRRRCRYFHRQSRCG